MKKLASILIVLISIGAFADGPCERRFTWSIDNGPIPIDEFRLYCDPSLAGPPLQVIVGTDFTYQAPVGLFPTGNYTCELTASDVEGESPRSNPVTFDASEGAACAVIIFSVDTGT